MCSPLANLQAGRTRPEDWRKCFVPQVEDFSGVRLTAAPLDLPAGCAGRAWQCLEKEKTWPVARAPAPPWCGRVSSVWLPWRFKPAEPREHRSGLCSHPAPARTPSRARRRRERTEVAEVRAGDVWARVPRG